ncbi:MAG: DUF2505 family protein [Deltaproteobacteria bacterium]|nr:DUF2505 family protein [Deltaproteobacteria bacterium]
MATLFIEHFFPGITPDEFWAMLLDKQFDRELQPALGVRQREELERKDDGKRLQRRIRMVPGFPAPAAVQKALDNVELEYMEESTYDRERGELHWVITPNVLKERVTARGVVRVRPEGNGVRRTIDGEVTVRLLGLGGLIEKLVKENTVRSYEGASRFTAEFIRQGRHKGLRLA